MKPLILSLVALAIASMGSGCAAKVVRDAHVYEQEIRFAEEMIKQLSETSLAEAEVEAKAGDKKKCEALAKNALIGKFQMPWHAAMMRFNAGLVEEKPPEQMPDAPLETEWCSQFALTPRSPMRLLAEIDTLSGRFTGDDTIPGASWMLGLSTSDDFAKGR